MSGRDTRIYVGNLPPDVRERDLEDLFDKYGKITYMDLKNRRDMPFAFIEFDDARDAEDALRARDGYKFDGYRIRVEYPKGSGGFRDRGRGGGGRARSGPNRRSDYRVVVTGLPPTGSWQDLKDHLREAGDICFADVYKDGTGIVEFYRHEDMKYAIKKLDDTKFKSHEGETAYIRIKEDRRSRSRSKSRDRSRSRSRSPKRARGSPRYSPVRRRDRSSSSRSRSRSLSKSRSRSRS